MNRNKDYKSNNRCGKIIDPGEIVEAFLVTGLSILILPDFLWLIPECRYSRTGCRTIVKEHITTKRCQKKAILGKSELQNNANDNTCDNRQESE
jgi:hypothetical protein